MNKSSRFAVMFFLDAILALGVVSLVDSRRNYAEHIDDFMECWTEHVSYTWNSK